MKPKLSVSRTPRYARAGRRWRQPPTPPGKTCQFQKNPVGVSGDRLVQGLDKRDYDDAVRDAVMKAQPGTISEPIELGDAWYVFAVSETAAKVHAFDDVKTQAERMLRAEKQREQFQALVAETLKARSVQLYPERIHEGPAKK